MVTSINPTTLHTPLRLEYRVSYLLYGMVSLIAISPSVQKTNVSLDCITDYALTSPNYPSYYPNDVSVEWYITAPIHGRIVVTFQDFSLEEIRDTLEILDMVNPRNVQFYTGEKKQFHPFLTLGNSVRLKFSSDERGRRKGFIISVSCYETSGGASSSLVGDFLGEGFLELPSQSGKWIRVCEDSISNIVAEVICGELGYPGMKEVTYLNGECLSDHLMNNTCRRAPICRDNTYRLKDCEPVNFTCTTNMSVKIKCYEPGFTGCYEAETAQLQHGLPFISTARCIFSCKSGDIQAVAIMNQEDCFCTTNAEARIEDASMCSEETETPSRMSVYSASVGFCEDLNDTTGGSWDSNITWFGSIVHLTCMDGYNLNGSDTLQCVPGVTPYYPHWNDTMPSCTMDGSTTAAPKLGRSETIIIVFAVTAIIILIAMVFAGCYKWTRKYHWKSRSKNRTGQSNGQSRSAKNRRGADTASRSSTTRHGNGSSTGNTINSTTPISVIPPVVPNNVPQDIQPPAPPSSHPSNTSDIPLTLLLQSNPRTDNHYVSSNSYPNPYYYASSTDTQRLVSSSLEEAYQEPSSMDMVNHAYEYTGDERGQSNVTLQSKHTLATELSMISRPLPHRPFSSNCNEGPTLPPRDTSLHYKKKNSSGRFFEAKEI